MNIANDLLLTRLAVLSLSSTAGWLPSISANEAEMLEYVFPKTRNGQQYNWALT